MKYVLLSCLSVLALSACSKEAPKEPEKTEQAVVPGKTELTVPDFEISTDPAVIAKGEEIFAAKGCTACHKIGGGKLVGPDLKGLLTRRDETWVKKMILHPDVMVKEDEQARKLLVEHLTPMPNQGVDPVNELPPLMAYLKSID